MRTFKDHFDDELNRLVKQLKPNAFKSRLKKMKSIILTVMTISIGIASHGQSKEEKEIIKEGTKLYKTEMASWYGTDIFLAKFSDRRQNTGGYFSYIANDKVVCVFFSNDENPKIIGTFTFDSTYNVNTAEVDGSLREPTKLELNLITIRQKALAEYTTDSLFKFYKDMKPNFIPLDDEDGKRVYVLTGPEKQGIVVFGNDYILTFDKKNKLKSKKRIHKNLITMEYGKLKDQVEIGGMHTHLPETGDLITATDVCTLMLYGKYTKWQQYIVISQKNVSLWNCKTDQLVVMTRDAWDKMSGKEKK